MKLSVVIPFYNEAGNADFVLNEVSEVLRAVGVEYEIIAVDDASKDETPLILKKAAARIPGLRVVTHPRNAGQTAAFWTGFDHSSGEWIVIMDGDRQNDFRDLPKMLAHTGRYDAVFGQRLKRNDPFYKIMASRTAYRVRNFFLKDGVVDTACAFKLFKRDALKYLIPCKGTLRFIPFLLKEAGVPFICVEVNHRPRVKGDSKYSLLKGYFLPTILDLMFMWWYKKTNLFRVRRAESADRPSGRGLPLFLLGIVAAFYAFRLAVPAEPYFDEVHYVRFIRELFIQGVFNQYLTVHPPLWSLLTGFMTLLFGDVSWVWRSVSLLAGLGVIGVLYALAQRMFNSRGAALVTAGLFAFDCLSLTQARSAMMNSLMLFLALTAVLFFLRACDRPAGHVRGAAFNLRALLWSGIFLGLALATKLVALGFLVFLGVLFFDRVREKRAPWFLSTVIFAAVFVALPAFLFGMSYAFIPFLKDRTFADIGNILIFHHQYNMTMTQTHPYSSHWWSWPLMTRPIWFYFESAGQVLNVPMVKGIICIGNPVIFWSIPLAMLYTLWDMFKRRSAAARVIILGFLVQWGQYAFFSRLQFFHYFYTAMPFVAMALALFLARIWRTGRPGRIFVVFYLFLVVAMFVYWYPLLTGYPVPDPFFRQHMWWRGWI
jgi:glycosyltransferase involved in cell wall biosynthesis/predicted membrane-bound dolichyl-phosphate-mannose-protein mannosyltransferase